MLFPHWGYSIFGISPNFTHFHPFSHFSICIHISICKGYLDHVFVQDTTHLFELCYACDSKPSRIRIRHQILVRPVASTYPPPPLSKLRPCPSYSRRRDRINLVLWRSLDKGGGG